MEIMNLEQRKALRRRQEIYLKSNNKVINPIANYKESIFDKTLAFPKEDIVTIGTREIPETLNDYKIILG